MRIIGFSFNKISVERKDNLEMNLPINQNIDIKEISSDNIPITKEEVLNIVFDFTIKYGEDIANLYFKGNILVLPEKDELKKILDDWKDKKMSENFRIFLFNFILTKCNIKALSLEDDLALPYHLQLPRLANNKETKN